jgi:hypothetical protein
MQGRIGKNMKTIRIQNNTCWPDPKTFRELGWKLIHAPNTLTKVDRLNAQEIIEAYSTLITHPAFALKHVTKTVSGIRRAMREDAE